jgi:hypothetical protein
LPSGAAAALANLPGVAMVLTGPVELSAVDIYGPQARRLTAMWNSLLAPASAADLAVLEGEPAFHDDAMPAPDLPPDGGMAAQNASIIPGYYQTSEFLTGSVAVGIVLVESTGAVDPSTENWTPDEKQQVFNEIMAALNWWVQREPRANLSFVVDDHAANPLPTGVEPISRPYTDQKYWIKDAMNALGYNGSTSYFTLARDYSNALRSAHGTDWAFTIFVVDSSADADNYFSNGYFAYAYLGGPFLVMTYGNNGYGPGNMDAVAAHEIGHIFYALDQYSSALQPCDRRSGYLYVENQNSLYGGCGSNVSSIMRGLISPYTGNAVDAYAAGQIGWRDTDADNILDPLDTALPVTLNPVTLDENNRAVASGLAQVIPYPSAFPYHASVTTNRLAGVQYRLNGGPWQPAQPADGAFNATTENFTFTTGILAPGPHWLEVAATDSAGNITAPYVSTGVVVYGDSAGGLKTVLYPPENGLVGQSVSATINGVAFNTPGKAIVGVEYRINGGAWQAVAAADGNFNSDYEPFTVSFTSTQAGNYLIEAFATDIDGNQETELASREVVIAGSQSFSLFLPLISK